MYAQVNDAASMKPILLNAIPYLQTIEQRTAEIVRVEFDILNVRKTTYRTLHEGYNYGIVAFGDYRISDIDLEVYKQAGSEWVFITKDTDARANAGVAITPLSSGLYRIDVICHRFSPGYNSGHYGLVVFHE